MRRARRYRCLFVQKGHTSSWCGPSVCDATIRLQKMCTSCCGRHGSRIRPLVAFACVAGPACWPEVGEAVRAAFGQRFYMLDLRPNAAAHPTPGEHRHTFCQLIQGERDDGRRLLPGPIPAKRLCALLTVLNPPTAAHLALILSPPWLMPLGVAARLLTGLLRVILRPAAADLSCQIRIGCPSGTHVLGASFRVLGAPPPASFAVHPPSPLRISTLPPLDGGTDLLRATSIPLAVVLSITDSAT